MIAVRCFGSLAEATGLRHEIDALNDLAARPDPFSTFAFLQACLRHDARPPAGQRMQLWFLAAFRGDMLVGYLALKRVARRVLGIPVATVDFLVSRDTDRPHPVARPEDLREVCASFYAYLLARRHDWSYLEFRQQDAASALFPPPAAVDRAGYLVRQWPTLENCTIPVRWTSLSAYFRALSKKLRSNLSRQFQALFAEGEVTLLGSSDPATTPALLELYLSIEAHSWKAQAQASLGRQRERLARLRCLLDKAQPMRVSIQVLLVDGVPIAGLINGAFRDGLHALHIVHDDRASRLAPGTAMLLLGMRQAIEGGSAYFNLLSGFHYYKARWLAEATELHVAQIYRPGSLPYWHRILGDWKRRVLPARQRETVARFNPLRRSLAPAASLLDLDVAGRARCDAMVAAVRRGHGEFLGSAGLAAVLPFPVQASPQAATASRGSRPRKDSSTTPDRLISSPASMPSTAPVTPNRSMPR